MPDLRAIQQTAEERAQSGYGDIDFSIGVGVPNWNPIAKVGYDPKAVGSLNYSNPGLMGTTAGFAPYGLRSLDTRPEAGSYDPHTASTINRTREKYKESRPEYLEVSYPVSINKKLMYLEDPKEFMKALKVLGLNEEDYPHNEDGMRRLKRRVLEHEFTHRGNRFLKKGNYNSGSPLTEEEIRTRAVTANKDEFDDRMYSTMVREQYLNNQIQNLESEAPFPSPTEEDIKNTVSGRVDEYMKLARERLKKLGRNY